MCISADGLILLQTVIRFYTTTFDSLTWTTVLQILEGVSQNCDWAKYQNRQSSYSILVTKLSFCRNDPLIRESFWQKNSLVTHILFELCLFLYLAHSQILGNTLYVKELWQQQCGTKKISSGPLSTYFSEKSL